MKTDPTLPEARLVPRNAEDRMTILRSQANQGARKAARATVKVCRVVTVLAIIGAGLAAVGSGIGAKSRARSHSLDDLDRRMESLRRINFEMPKLDKLEFDRLRFQVERDLHRGTWDLQPDPESVLISEDIHQPTW